MPSHPSHPHRRLPSRIKAGLDRVLDCRPLWRIALGLSVLAILFLATTANPYPVPSSSSDKINHLAAFLELTILTRLAWPELRARWFVPGLLAFGLGLELIQANLPHREFSLADLAADAVGIGLGLLPWPGLRRGSRTDLRPSPESV